MFINYYFITGCTFSPYQGKNVIFAPDGTDEELLHQYDFQKAENGRYFRILTEKEYEAIMRGYPDNNVTFSYENSQPMYDNPYYRNNPPPARIPEQKVQKPDSHTGNIICLISALLLAAGLWIIFILKDYYLPAAGLLITGNILTIFARTRYPENIFGKVLFVCYLILYVLFVIFTFLVIVACVQCITSCNNCNIPG